MPAYKNEKMLGPCKAPGCSHLTSRRSSTGLFFCAEVCEVAYYGKKAKKPSPILRAAGSIKQMAASVVSHLPRPHWSSAMKDAGQLQQGENTPPQISPEQMH